MVKTRLTIYLISFGRKGYDAHVGSKWIQGRGIQIDAGRLHWISTSKATLRGGYVYGNLGAEWGPVTLVRRAGHWRIVSFKIEEISGNLPTSYSAASV
jgi:hypothetical protein